MKKNIYWLLPVLTCIVASVASVFLPVLTYIYPNGSKASFNVLSFVEQSEDLLAILASYNDPYEMYIDKVWLTILAVLAVLAILTAFAGVITMSL